jgi:dTDP-4-amino-4,6-dideoxygalactose transaminase
MPKIIKIAEDYNLKVVEDSACAFDSWIGNKHAGTFGDVGCFSFHPRKAICTGEGGMLITSDKDISDTVKSLRDHGAEKSDLQRHKEKGGSLLPEFKMRGYNYRMTDIQGAIGVCQMKKADYIMSGRKRIARKYNEALKPFSFLKTPFVPENFTHGYQSYVCLFSDVPIEELNFAKVQKLNLLRNTFMEKLEENGIATRQGTHAVHTLAYYKQKYGLQDEDYFYSYAADRLSITLPVYADMTDEEFDYVIKNIREFAPICVE